MIRTAADEDLNQLVHIYRASFEKHNIFQKVEESVKEYMESKQAQGREGGGGFFVAVEDSKVVGGILLEFVDVSRKAHARVKLKHLAVQSDYRKRGIGSELVQYVLDQIGQLMEKGLFTSVKVQANTVDNIDFYRKLGFKQEATLSDHYRLGEKCFIMGKLMR